MFKCIQILYEENKEHDDDVVIILPNGHNIAGALSLSSTAATNFLKYIRSGGGKFIVDKEDSKDDQQ